jgi:hypothetical protein
MLSHIDFFLRIFVSTIQVLGGLSVKATMILTTAFQYFNEAVKISSSIIPIRKYQAHYTRPNLFFIKNIN